jgi:2-haloacid dehalogenase
VISADVVKTYKSSPARVWPGFKAPGRAQSAIAFVSSNFWDLVGTKSYGFWTRWVNRCNLAGDELGVKPDCTVQTLDRLNAVLG